ncbi:hypothetical protein D3C80_1714220 [compost metagenome]
MLREGSRYVSGLRLVMAVIRVNISVARILRVTSSGAATTPSSLLRTSDRVCNNIKFERFCTSKFSLSSFSCSVSASRVLVFFDSGLPFSLLIA